MRKTSTEFYFARSEKNEKWSLKSSNGLFKLLLIDQARYFFSSTQDFDKSNFLTRPKHQIWDL